MVLTLRKTALIYEIWCVLFFHSTNAFHCKKRRIHSLINHNGITFCLRIIILHLRLRGVARHDESGSFLNGLLRFEVVYQSIDPRIIGRKFFEYHIVDGTNPSY